MVEAWIPSKAPAAYESKYRRLAVASAAFVRENAPDQLKEPENDATLQQEKRDSFYYLLSVANDSFCSSVRGFDENHGSLLGSSHYIFPDINLHQVNSTTLLASGLVMRREFQQISSAVLTHPKRYFRPTVVRKVAPREQDYHMLTVVSPEVLSMASSQSKSSTHPFTVSQILDWEYGYWNIPYRFFCVDKSTDRFDRDTMTKLWMMWQDLSRSIVKGRMGWVGACLPLNGNAKSETQHLNSFDEWVRAYETKTWDGSMRIYCFGHAVAHIWALLFVLSEKLTRSGLEWFDSGDNLTIRA